MLLLWGLGSRRAQAVGGRRPVQPRTGKHVRWATVHSVPPCFKEGFILLYFYGPSLLHEVHLSLYWAEARGRLRLSWREEGQSPSPWDQLVSGFGMDQDFHFPWACSGCGTAGSAANLVSLPGERTASLPQQPHRFTLWTAELGVLVLHICRDTCPHLLFWLQPTWGTEGVPHWCDLQFPDNWAPCRLLTEICMSSLETCLFKSFVLF